MNKAVENSTVLGTHSAEWRVEKEVYGLIAVLSLTCFCVFFITYSVTQATFSLVPKLVFLPMPLLYGGFVTTNLLAALFTKPYERLEVVDTNRIRFRRSYPYYMMRNFRDDSCSGMDEFFFLKKTFQFKSSKVTRLDLTRESNLSFLTIHLSNGDFVPLVCGSEDFLMYLKVHLEKLLPSDLSEERSANHGVL